MLYPKDTDAYLYDYCIGGKTGYTNAAGNTLVTYAQKDGMTLLAVILKGASPQYWNETRALFDFGFENFNLCNVSEYFEADESYDEEKYDSLNTNDPYAQIDPQARIILPKTVNFSKTDMKISYENLPDDALAQLKYTYGKRNIGTANIIRTHTLIDKNDMVVDDSSGNEQEEVLNNSEQLSEDNNLNKDSDTINEPEQEDIKKDKENDNPGIIEKIKSFDMIGKIKNFDIGEAISNISNWFSNIKFEFSMKNMIIAGSIILGIVFLIILKTVFQKSYLIRQKIANYRNRKRAQKQYIVIRDSRRTRRGRRRR